MAVGRTAVVDGLGADSFELLDVVEASEHSDAVEEDCEVKEVKDKEEGEVSPKPVKQIANGLDSVMVSGMLRNISDKVATKLKQDEIGLQCSATLWHIGISSLTSGGLQRWLHVFLCLTRF